MYSCVTLKQVCGFFSPPYWNVWVTYIIRGGAEAAGRAGELVVVGIPKIFQVQLLGDKHIQSLVVAW